jgi:hypothetical protein
MSQDEIEGAEVEEISEAASVDTTTASVWKYYEVSEYQEMAQSLIHFTSKTVNSNAKAAGIRLAANAGLNLPYVSARALMGAGVSMPLDYLEGGAMQAGKMKQINSVLRDTEFSKGASSQEREAIVGAVNEARKSTYCTGMDLVDSRLRQLLIPKEDSPDDYVTVTPITASGVCDYLLNSEDGLVAVHNQNVKTDRDREKTGRRRIRQARYGIGGANPQNVGSLVRSMTRPILVSAPAASVSVKKALRIFYKGIQVHFAPSSVLWEPLQGYRTLRARMVEESSFLSPSEVREREETLVAAISATVLELGREALECLEAHRAILPVEHAFMDGAVETPELISRQVPGVIRGLIDSRLRDFDYRQSSQGRLMDWPREAAEFITSRICAAKVSVGGESIAAVPLDQFGRNSLVALIEEGLS